MKLVTRDDIERWADQYTAKADLPYLISRLIRATTPTSTQFDVPSGSAVFIGGWDGIVNCEAKTSHVSKGKSLWEFGTEGIPKAQAERNYIKRTKDSLGYDISKCTFVFVTARFWKDKNEWKKEKSDEGKWGGIEVYDSSDLEQWLDGTMSVARWFSSHVGSYPFDGIMTPDEFWEEWSIGPNGLVLMPEVITAGREYELNQLLSTLQGQASIKGVKASTKNEAIAFIIAAAKRFVMNESEQFFSKSLIIDTEGNFRGIRINTANPLNLIPRFEETQPLYAAVSRGHHVLVPLGADDSFNQETITLPTIDRDGQIKSLIQSGITKDNAERFSRESGRNITILKKLIGFPHTKAKWVDKENIREIIPALLLGRWNESFIGDIELIEKLSEQKYANYVVTLKKWKNFEESPLIQIGETWRLTSPLDLWTTLSLHLTQKDFQKIRECFLLAFKSGNPRIEPKDKDDFATFFNKPRSYSSWAREGLTQSLILVGRFGDGFNIPNLSNPQLWVDSIIFDLLNNASGRIWISIDHELPLISEASPLSFIKAANNSLSKEQPEIMEMFRGEDGFIHKTFHHTGLLWALEGLAWIPDYLRDVSLILLKLSRLDPGGNLLNRPINSIVEIFKPWHYQTLAPYDERMSVLRYVTEKEKESGWMLLIGMLPEQHNIAHPSYKMRWRMFDKNTNLTYKYPEIWNTCTYVVELLFDLFDNNEDKFAQLINKTIDLSPDDRRTVLDWTETIYSQIEQKEFTAWETIRKILNDHRSYPDTDWALSEAELSRLEDLYKRLQPTDIINKFIWLFNENWPAFVEGFRDSDNEFEKMHEQQQRKIDQARNEAVTVFLKELGLKKTLDLRKQVEEPWALGDTLAMIITKQEDVFIVCECLNDDRDHLRFIHSFIFRKSLLEGIEWIKNLVNSLQKKGFSRKALANILIPLTQSKILWEFVFSLNDEIQNKYWQNIYPSFRYIPVDEKILGVEMLMKYKRFFSAMDICSHFITLNEMPTKLLTEVLRKAATEKASEEILPKEYQIERILGTLDKRIDLEKSVLINLEWLYLPFLGSFELRRNPKVLEEELAKNPDFFIEVLKWVYIPKDKQKLEEERIGVSDDIIRNRAKQASHLLRSWKKIPGLKEDNSIDETDLKAWIKKVRILAEEASRLEVADMQIGQVLAQYPENIPQWPQEKIFAIIEEINSDSLKSNYSSAMFNKRSFSPRGPFEGGNIERDRAAYFRKLSNDYKNTYPNVAEIFRRMEQGYLADAKQMDEQAERDRLEF